MSPSTPERSDVMAWMERRHRPLEWTLRLDLQGAPARGSRTAIQRGRATSPPGCDVIIPTDLVFAAWRQLFPAERMMIFGARQTSRGTRVTSLSDVTEPRPSVAYVRACPERMATSLIDLERTGAHLGVWIHSHPGQGSGATHPSQIDLNQDQDLRRHYTDRLIGIIAVRDGWLRVWGQAVHEGRARVRWIGHGIEPHPGEAHVYRLKL